MTGIDTGREGSTTPTGPSEQADIAAGPRSELPGARRFGVTPDADRAVRPGRSGPITSDPLTRRGRVRKWDRSPEPHDWRFYVGGVGKTLIAVGLLMFGFVGYQLYGTGIETAAAQNELQDDFEQQLALVEQSSPVFVEGDDSGSVVDAPSIDSDDADAPTGAPIDSDDDSTDSDDATEADPVNPAGESVAPPAVPIEAQNIPADLADGDVLARIEIPSIGVDDYVVAGVATGDLKRGPGHFPDTPLPGQLGNAAIAGHRTTYGQPFRNVDQLRNGDEIEVTTLSGVFVYRVTGQQIVTPSDYQVVATTDPTVANLTLTSCHPVFTARERIVIFSELDRVESDPVGEPVINYGRTEVANTATEIPGDVELPADDEGADDPVDSTDDVGSTVDPVTGIDSERTGVDGESTGSLTDDAAGDVDRPGSQAANAGIADAFSDGWFSDPAANLQVGLWGVAVGTVALAAYALSRRFRHDLLGLAVGSIPFTLALYFFFQNVNRLLPPNL